MFILEKNIPTPNDYMDIRASAGMTQRSLDGVKKGLGNEIFSVIIKNEFTGEVVGMGRIIGDGGTVFQICDMAVKNEWQGKGGGTLIMNSLMDYISENVQEKAYINLLADIKGFYEKWGFKPTSPNSIGMYIRKI